ncbi:MAG TPA: hypothetical protein PKA00_23650 [Saprospiraceae bacterium]|nr:hypothetical protein [Saprospiraceae bacterium]HMQ85925.1 hypothetical protein [Saprospiraceae bacterium]
MNSLEKAKGQPYKFIFFIFWTIIMIMLVLKLVSPIFRQFWDVYWMYFLPPFAILGPALLIIRWKKDPEFRKYLKKKQIIYIALFGGAILFGIIFTLIKVLSVKG